MTDRPILMSAPMVRTLLAGTKTQTRRVVKNQPHGEVGQVFTGWYHPTVIDRYGDEQPGPETYGAWTADGEWGMKSPYGQPGDRLWVRENGWQRPERTPRMMREGADTWEPYYFDADGLSEQESADFKAWGFKRRPSIHMPRRASRITLEVTGVRVERLKEISREDAIAEGTDWQTCPSHQTAASMQAQYAARKMGMAAHYEAEIDYVSGYRKLWESINGPGSWEANPWVWVVEFKRSA